MSAYDGMTPLEIFRKIAFELKSYPDDVVQAHIDLAGAMFCADAYGDEANMFLALCAAHLMVIPGGVAASSGTGAAPKGVKSIKEGDLQITYADDAQGGSDSASLTAWFKGSRFGDMINMLRRTHGLTLGFTANAGFVCYEDGGYYFPNRGIH